MVQDVPRFEIPDNAVWLAQDVFINRDGGLSKRGGITTAMSSSSTIEGQSVGILRSLSPDGITRGYIAEQSGGAGGDLYAFTPANGTFALTQITSAAVAASIVNPGAAFQWSNFLLFPNAFDASLSDNGCTYAAGATGSKSDRTTAANYTITAGSPTISGPTAADIAAIETGMIAVLEDAGTHIYIGRIVSIDSGANTFDVEPLPTTTFTSTAANSTIVSAFGFSSVAVGGTRIVGAGCGCSFQNRVVLGDIAYNDGSPSIWRNPARVAWSILPTETPSGGIVQGACALHYKGYEANSYVDLPDLQQIVGVVPMQDQSLLVLGLNALALLTGTLTTQTTATTVASFTYSVRTLSQRIGCLSQTSIQRTASGVVFASREGVMMFDGRNILNLMESRLQTYWKTIVAAGATILGSAILTPNHYYISTSSGGFLCNLDGFRWTLITNAAITGNSAFDVGSGYRCFALKNPVSASSTSDKLLHLEQMLLPTSSNRSDAVGSTVVTPVIQTKTDSAVVYSAVGARLRMSENPTWLKRYKHVEVRLKMVGGSATTTVTATPGIEAEETSQTALTFSPSANPQVKRTALYNPAVISHAMAYTITTTGACDSLDLYAIESDVIPLRLSRTA